MGEATRPLYRGLVSVKGVVVHEGAVVLLKNQRGEWELPGGKLEAGESLTECLAREFAEELGQRVAPGPILDAGLHHVYPDIVVVTYGCYPEPFSAIRHSDEHRAVGWFQAAELEALTIALGYRRSIAAWMRDGRGRGAGGRVSGDGPHPRRIRSDAPSPVVTGEGATGPWQRCQTQAPSPPGAGERSEVRGRVG